MYFYFWQKKVNAGERFVRETTIAEVHNASSNIMAKRPTKSEKVSTNGRKKGTERYGELNSTKVSPKKNLPQETLDFDRIDILPDIAKKENKVLLFRFLIFYL